MGYEEQLGQEVFEDFVVPEILPEERPEEYLCRVYEAMDDRFIYPLSHPGSGPALKEAFRLISINANTVARAKFSEKKNREILCELKRVMKMKSGGAKTPDLKEGQRSYKGFIRERVFLNSSASMHLSYQSYARLMFFVEYSAEESMEYLKQKVVGKNIWLLGGADSVQDLLNADSEMQPASIVNIDPYIGEETATKNPYNIYLSESIDASDDQAVKEMREKNNIPLADEMWALYSVPYYLQKPRKIIGLFKMIIENLAPGGAARIHPIETQKAGLFINCRKAFMKQIGLIMNMPDFNVYIAGETLIIERLPE